MAVQFILGRSGTGKTSLCVRQIANELTTGGEQPLIFLVPEQATYQAERAILSEASVAGYSRLQVLSFQRLAFMLWGKNCGLDRLSAVGREMIIQRILQTRADELRVLGPGRQRASQASRYVRLASEVSRAVVQLLRNAAAPAELAELTKKLSGTGKQTGPAIKFDDLALVYNEYLDFIEGRFTDPEAECGNARELVSGADLIKTARLWVDGFSGFTGAELQMLAELLQACSETKIALCLDPAKIDTSTGKGAGEFTSLFYPTERTYRQLLEIVNRSGLQLTQPEVLCEPRRFASPGPAHIEKNLFTRRPERIAQDESVQVVCAQNGRAEAEFIAREIVRLVCEQGLRYRDIAVAASDIGGYQHYIEACFADYEIPFFIDRRRPLRQHPLAELICSALRAVCGDWCGTDVFGYLKSDLGPVSRYEADMLENYCLAFAPTVKDWLGGEWDFAGKEDAFDETRINEIRARAAGPLVEFYNKLGGADGSEIECAEFVRAVWAFVERLNVPGRLGEWAQQELGAGELEKADEHRQVFEQFAQLLDELYKIFQGRSMAAQDWLGLVEAGLSQMSLAFIPPGLDQVLVGSIERSRHPELKAVFLPGASQKNFPVPLPAEGVLSDEDRTQAARAGLELGDTTEQQLAARQYLAYIAFTRPAQRLYVTYPLADSGGQAVSKSEFVSSLCELFEGFSERFYEPRQHDIEQVRSRSELVDFLCVRLGRENQAKGANRLVSLAAGMRNRPDFAGATEPLQEALAYDNVAKLEPKFVERYFAGDLYTSASRLTGFAACPYKHFASHILKLKRRRLLRFEPIDVGEFYHLVLQELFTRLDKANLRWADAPAEKLDELLYSAVDAVLNAHPKYTNFKNHSAHNAYILDSATETLSDFVAAMSELSRVGSFHQVAAEIKFGTAAKKLGELVVELADGKKVRVNGKIDRLDVDGADGRTAVVFDYKRTARKQDWSKLYNGLDLQLPIYLLAVEGKKIGDNGPLIPAGGFYLPVEISAKSAKIGDINALREKFAYKARGIFSGEYAPMLDEQTEAGSFSPYYGFAYYKKDGTPYSSYGKSDVLRSDDFEAVLKWVRNKIGELGERIISGDIVVKPYRMNRTSPCTYCDYRPVCRFDWRVNDYNPLTGGGKKQVLEKIRQDGNGQE